MGQEAFEQRDLAVVLGHQDMAQVVADGQGAQGADGVHEKRMRAVEGVDVAAAIGGPRPAPRLHRAGTFQGHFVRAALPGVLPDAPFLHEAQQIAVGADVVEAVIVDARVGEVRRHEATVWARPDSRNSRSPVASNCRMAEPN